MRSYRSVGLEALAAMEYPGRFIIIGSDLTGENDVIIYGITGRSPSSRARRMSFDERTGIISVEPTDKALITPQNRNLLIYPAMMLPANDEGGVVVSNGLQTKDIFDLMSDDYSRFEIPADILKEGLQDWSYEPDAPNHTPRISGCIVEHGVERLAAIAMIKRDSQGRAYKTTFEVPLEPGKGKLIATYSGKNVNPLPSFEGGPLDVRLNGRDILDNIDRTYAVLAPKDSCAESDLRVSIAAVYWPVDTSKPMLIATKQKNLGMLIETFLPWGGEAEI